MKYLPFLMSSMLVFGSAVLLGGCSQIGTTGGVVTPQASQASGVKLTVRMSFVARIVQAEIADLDHYLVELRVTKDNLADNRSLLVAVGASPATFEGLLAGDAKISVSAFNASGLKIGEGSAETVTAAQNQAVEVTVELLPTVGHLENRPENTGISPNITFFPDKPTLRFPAVTTLETSEETRAPSGLALAPDGTLYVASKYGNCVYKITGEHLVETFTGFFAPTDVAVDSQGNVFICESGKHRILKWDGLNAPALFAGSADGKPGRQDGIGSSARFDYPCGIAVDKAGNVFVADNANASIREISAEGEVTTVICPDRTESKSKEDNVSCPWDVAVDDFGNLFIADGDALKFFRGDFTVRLKDYAHSPFSLVAEKSGVFVVSYEDGAVTHVSAAGLTQDLVKKNDLFAHPNGIALAPDGKTLFVSDIASVPVNGQGAIRKIALN